SSGLVYFGPYEIATQGIWTIHDQNLTVTSSQSRAAKVGANRFNRATNYAQEVNWSSTATQAPENSKITMYKYFTEADTSDYNEINMYFRFKYEGNSTVQASDSDYGMTFLMDTDSKNVSGAGKVCAFAAISKRALSSFGDGRWRLLTIDKSDNSIKIDGFPIAPSERILLLNDSIIPNRVKIDFNTSGQEFWNERGSFGIDEIYFSKTFARFIAQDKNYVEYKKEGVLLESQNGFPIFSDLKARLSSNESLTFFEQKNKKTKGDINANASASFKAAQIAFDLNAARVAGSDYAISSASHSISSAEPILKTLYFTEEFNFDGDGKSAAKGNSAKLNFSKLGLPLMFSGLSKVESSEWALNAKNEEAAELRLGSDKGGWLLRLSSERNQKALKSNGVEPLSTSNYFYTWLKSTEKEFSSGDSAASKRKVGGKIENTIFLPWSGLTPKIDFATEENYSAAKNYYYSDKNTFTFSVPFKIQKNAFEFSWKKTNGAVQTTSKGGNYGDDLNELFTSYNGRKYYFAAAPIYDLISWNLSENVHSKTQNLLSNDSGESEYYNGEYAFSFKRPIYADKRDFYIPTKVAFAFSRDIRAAKTLSDTYQGKLTLGWTAFNIFGKYGSIPIAKWFEQDEYLSSFIAALKFPRANPSDISQTYTTYLQANFYITKDNVFKNGVELEFQDQNNFTAKATV
ncbi:MAG: hypothetical protein K6A42_11390, partial [Treponema sp.]|nr:hypothetical protein [Treponema sp.]